MNSLRKNQAKVLVILLMLVSLTGLAQNKISDSLSHLLAGASGEHRVKLLNDVTINLWLNNPDLALRYAKEAVALSKQLKNQRLTAVSIRLMGGVHIYQGEYDTALAYAQKAHQLSLDLHEPELLTNTFNNIGFLYYLLGNYPEALENLLRALQLKKKIHQSYGLGHTLTNIGFVYAQLKQFDEARLFFNEAIAHSEQMHDNDVKLDATNGIGFSYLQEERVDMAQAVFKESLRIANNLNNKNWHAVALSGLGETYLHQRKLDSAAIHFRASLQKRKDIGDNNGISETYYYLSKLCEARHQLDSAFYYLNASQVVATKVKAKNRLLENYKWYRHLFTRKMQFDSALHYQTLYTTLLESWNQENANRSMAGIVLKLKEEETIKELDEKKHQLKQKNAQILFAFVLAVLTLGFAYIFYRSYQRQKRLSAELHSLNLEKNNLLGIVAHDLKSPLNQILGLISLLKMASTSISDEAKQYIQMMEGSASRLTAMINKILNVESLEAKGLPLSMERINFSDVVKSIARNNSLQAKRKNLDLQLNVIDDVRIRADKSYIEQIVENLISNAIKFSPTSKTIFVHLDVQDNKAVLEVKDQGPGLTEADKKKLFKKYQRLSAMPTANESSTGLGLSIVKKFADAMKGELWCESEAGKGASFFVRFAKAA